MLLRFLAQAHEVQGIGDDFDMRFFMCENFEYDPPKSYSKDRAKVLENTITVCHF